ncbi:uncharacterized protein LOC133194623 [Saccostrea echinata]|uniref:uncharacterized protein LOC133194623 n=1 Tax=Saccostrea echinata TaxID=191078 RepID=UPI002A838F98|nr:uncharacterized protein LOC133194623 [Saccostrea echinata]
MNLRDTGERNRREEDLYIYVDHEFSDGGGYLEPIGAKPIEKLSVNTNVNQSNTSTKSWKPVLVILLISFLICGLVTTSALFALEKSKTYVIHTGVKDTFHMKNFVHVSIIVVVLLISRLNVLKYNIFFNTFY